MRLPSTPLTLPLLPYNPNAFEPMLSEEAMKVHYLGHHKGYVDAYNKLLLEGGKYEDKEFNYFGHLLHSIYWTCLTPTLTQPDKILQNLILDKYPSISYFFEKIINDAVAIKGSGWLLLDSNLNLNTIPNHDLSNTINKPILIIDGWEHSWYLDYKNKKKDFFKNVIQIINWDTVLRRLQENYKPPLTR